MATVRVSFLLGGERFHGRPNRSSVLSDVPAKATRLNRAGPGYKVIRLRGLSHTDNMARTRQYFHFATDEGPVISLSPSAPRSNSCPFRCRGRRARVRRRRSTLATASHWLACELPRGAVRRPGVPKPSTK